MQSDSETLRKAALEDFWGDLLAFIEEGRVMPVVGSELCVIRINGQDLPLYRTLAERLLQRYGYRAIDATSAQSTDDKAIALRVYSELNDAVSALVQRVPRLRASDL